MVVLLSATGEETCAILRNLLAPALLKLKTLDYIMKILDTHFEHRQLVITVKCKTRTVEWNGLRNGLWTGLNLHGNGKIMTSQAIMMSLVL